MNREIWSENDKDLIKKHFPISGVKILFKLIPDKTKQQIKSKAHYLGCRRFKPQANSKLCNICLEVKLLNEFPLNRATKNGYHSYCKICTNAKTTQRYRNNLTLSRQKRNERMKKWYSSNPKAKLIQNLRSRMRKVLKGLLKCESSKKLIGCDGKFLQEHIEKQFQTGMTWDNYGDWHIDHMKPCSSFDLSDPVQQKWCFHYSNLRPLWAQDNLSKGSKLV